MPAKRPKRRRVFIGFSPGKRRRSIVDAPRIFGAGGTVSDEDEDWGGPPGETRVWMKRGRKRKGG